jgi:hypothetical protein
VRDRDWRNIPPIGLSCVRDWWNIDPAGSIFLQLVCQA